MHCPFNQPCRVTLGGLHGVPAFLDARAETEGVHASWVAEGDCIILSDRSDAMQQFSTALQVPPQTALKPGLLAVAAVNSPMQCMMNEVCAQCQCRHVDQATGETAKFVFPCFNQRQPLFDLDFANLQAPQGQNRVQEKRSSVWLAYVIAAAAVAKANIPQPMPDLAAQQRDCFMGLSFR